jgi:hypothetical protein
MDMLERKKNAWNYVKISVARRMNNVPLQLRLDNDKEI